MPEKTVTLKAKRENAVHDILYPPHSSLVSSSDKGKYYCNEIKKDLHRHVLDAVP